METTGFLNVQAFGRVGKDGVGLRQDGTDCAAFLLNVPEQSRDGKHYISRVPVEIWGTHAHETLTLPAGQWVLVTGKLRRRKRPDDEWAWCVSGCEARAVGPPPSGSAPRQASLF